MGLLGGVGEKGILKLGNIPDKVPMNTEKAASKTNGEIDSNVGDMSLKHELQMQLMAENMEGIMHMIAHRMDTLEREKVAWYRNTGPYPSSQ